MAVPPQPDDRPAIGILLMLGFCGLAPLADAVAKLLGDRMDVGQLVLIRFLAQMVLLGPIVLHLGRFEWPTGRILRLTMVRTVLHIIGIGTMFLALRYLPLADAIAIAFVMPFILLILGHFVLHETVGRRRIIACFVGFLGTLMVIQPSFANVGWPALLPLVVAVVFALFILVTRSVAKEIDPLNLQTVSGIFALALLVPVILIASVSGIPGLRLSQPEASDWGLVIALGALGTIGHLLMTWSLRFAPSATLAPMQYLEIPFAALIGWLIFRDFPNGLAFAGIVLTIAAGIYVLMRERAINRSATQAQGPAPPVAE